jgi:hypothetical protein
MKRMWMASSMLAVALSVVPSSVVAQTAIFVMGGLTVPTGDYGELANAGWMAQAGAMFSVAPAVAVGVGGLYGMNSHESPPDGDKTNLYGGLGIVQYTFVGAAVTPYVYGGAGFITHSYKSEAFPAAEGSSSGLAATAGAGLDLPLGGQTGFVEAEYLTGFGDVDGTDLFVVSAGVAFAVGG